MTDTLTRLQGLTGRDEDRVWQEARWLFNEAKEAGTPISHSTAFEIALDRLDDGTFDRRDASLRRWAATGSFAP